MLEWDRRFERSSSSLQAANVLAQHRAAGAESVGENLPSVVVSEICLVLAVTLGLALATNAILLALHIGW
jgi:hypothetical protein